MSSSGLVVICTDENNACQHGGVCKTFADEEDNFCDCPDNTLGLRCHTILEPKELSVCNTNGKECLNGGTCTAANQVVDGITKEANYCDCPIATYGAVCHNEPPKEATPTGASVCTVEGKQCLNGGTCVPSTEVLDGKTVQANKCVCPLDTFGDVCHNQPQKDEAAQAAAEAALAELATSTQDELICTKDGNQCQNGGFCVLKSNDGSIPENYCACPANHKGKRCHGTPPRPGTITSAEISIPCTKDGDECKNGGECRLKDLDNNIPATRCKCTKSYFGETCEKDICTANGDCENGGVCTLASKQQDMSEGNYCSCPAGTSGYKCERKAECTLDCQHGSSCRHNEDITHANDDGDTKSDFCECVGNYKGTMCEIPFETCPTVDGKSLDCLWGGKCTTKDGAPACDCPEDRSGVNCLVGSVSNIQDWNGPCYQDEDCKNSGLCIRTHDAEETKNTGMNSKTTQCLCSLGWGGDNCEVRCNSLNCQHGSSCRFPSGEDITHANDTPEAGAYCDCADLPFKGKECEIAVTNCPDGTECLYGGQCIGSVEDDDDEDGYQCACPPGRMGMQCEKMDHAWKGDDNAYTPHATHSVGTSQTGVDPSILGVSIAAGLILAIIPIVLICLKRNREKQKSAVNDIANECLDDLEDTTAASETDSKTNGNGTNGHTANGNGVSNGEVHDDDFFDYDNDGVVNVNLDENEAVPLPKDKQIV